MLLNEIYGKTASGMLYHGTSRALAMKILGEDIIRANTHHLIPNRDIQYGVSMTRSLKFAMDWDMVVLALDRQILNQKYEILPFDFYGFSKLEHEKKRSEAEEFVITDSNSGIAPLRKYLREIHMFENYAKPTLPEHEYFKPLFDHPLLITHQ